jgi:hypothetical protein
VGFALVVATRLALGAIPSALGSGDPDYLAAAPTDAGGPAANVTGLSADRYPDLPAALASGRSDLSPLAAHEALAAREPDAFRNGEILVVDGDEHSLVEVTR